MRSVRDAAAFEVEAEGVGPAFSECVRRELQDGLKSRFSVSRQLPDGTYERFFRIDGDAEASHSFDVETPQARDERLETQRRRMDPSVR